MTQQPASRNGAEGTGPRILIVDDEDFVREAMELYFATEGFHVFAAPGGSEALEILAAEQVDIAILDILMPGMDGIQLLREMKKAHPDVEVVMASGCGTIESAIESMRLGAYDYVTKPILNFDEDLLKVVRKALERRRLLATNRKLSRDLQDINRELKATNARLKRRIAELEVLYETGRMLAELSGVEPLLDLAGATLEHQLGIERALVLLEEPQGWRVRRAVGFPQFADPAPLMPLAADFLQQSPEPWESLTFAVADSPNMVKILGELGAPPAAGLSVVAAPLRAAGESLGLLIVLEEKNDPAAADQGASEERLRLIRMLAAQISAPLALHRDQVSH